MKNYRRFAVIMMSSILVVGCGSMRPPTTNPYYPGYHARDAREVNAEYQNWQVEQQEREERTRIQDSLQTQFENQYAETRYNRGNSFQQYNFYSGGSPWAWRYNRWHRPYYGSRNSFSFYYSNQPWFIDSWWADDYLWDQYFWGWNRYTYDPYSYYSPYYHTGLYYYDPYYDYWYGDQYYYIIDGEGTPTTRRPRNRDRFTGNRPGTNTPSSIGIGETDAGMVRRPDIKEKTITPAVVDREKINTRTLIDIRRPANRGRFNTGQDDQSSSSARAKAPAYSPPAASTSSSSSKSVRSSSSDSSNKGNKSSSSGKSQKRPKNRRH